MKLRRVALATVVSAALCLATGQGVAFAQPPGSVAAGEYHKVVQAAGGFFFDPTSGTFVNINVFHTLNEASPKDGTPTTTETTQVILNAFEGGASTFGCFDIKPSDFTVGAGTAALHTSITSGNPTCNAPFGIQPPYAIDATWTSTTPAIRFHNDTQFMCGGYGRETADTTLNQGANANVAVSTVLQGTLTMQGNIGSDDLRQHANGVQPDNCQPSGATPGGAGPPPAGDYRTSTTTASFFVQTPGSFEPELDVFVTNTSSQSTPKDGPATNSTQFEVSIFSTIGGNFGVGCFKLTPADFTSNGTSSATLNTTFPTNPQLCSPFSQVTLPLPLTVNIAWTGSGPVATMHSVGDLTCLSYRNQGEGVIVTNNANVSATLSQLSPDTFSGNGVLATQQSNNHAEGSLGPPCPI